MGFRFPACERQFRQIVFGIAPGVASGRDQGDLARAKAALAAHLVPVHVYCQSAIGWHVAGQAQGMPCRADTDTRARPRLTDKSVLR